MWHGHRRYGPARQELAKTWRVADAKLSAKRRKVDSAKIWQDTMQAISDQGLTDTDEWAKWTMNCGRSVAKKHGPQQLAKDSSIVRYACGKDLRILKLSKGGLKFAFTKPEPVIVAKFEELGVTIAKGRAPKTIKQWNHNFSLIADACEGVPGVRGQYTKFWLARSALIWLMRKKNIQKLSMSNETPDELAKGCPDQNKHILRFSKGHHTVYAMLNDLGYDGPPELFSMYCCLFADRGVMSALKGKPEAWIRQNLRALRDLRKQYKAKHVQNPYPVVLLRMFIQHEAP